MAQPQHLDVRQLTVEEREELENIVPTIEILLVNRGRIDINGDPAALNKTCDKFQRLFNARIQVQRSQFVAINKKITFKPAFRQAPTPCLSPGRGRLHILYQPSTGGSCAGQSIRICENLNQGSPARDLHIPEGGCFHHTRGVMSNPEAGRGEAGRGRAGTFVRNACFPHHGVGWAAREVLGVR